MRASEPKPGIKFEHKREALANRIALLDAFDGLFCGLIPHSHEIADFSRVEMRDTHESERGKPSRVGSLSNEPNEAFEWLPARSGASMSCHH